MLCSFGGLFIHCLLKVNLDFSNFHIFYLSIGAFHHGEFQSSCCFNTLLLKSHSFLQQLQVINVGLGGLVVTCFPRDPKFAGSNSTEVEGFFQDVKILSTSPLGGTLSWGSRVRNFRLIKEPQVGKK